MAPVAAQSQDKLSGNDKAVHAVAASLIHQSPEDFLPLSYSQQRLWFLDQLDPGSFTYNLFAAYRLKGDLNVAALEQSFNDILRRHEVLRTVFKSENGNPLQVVLPVFGNQDSVIGSSEHPARRKTAGRKLGEFSEKKPCGHFDLATGPLLRITVVQAGRR